MDKDLQQSFLKGTPAKDLDGFYKGALLQFIPTTPLESFAGLITKVWLPWYGKKFNKDKHSGINKLPSYVIPPLRLLFGEKISGEDTNNMFAFPFKTSTQKGLKDPMQVMQLDYDSPENPALVRNVVDELVTIGNNTYLGKAYLKKNNNVRLLAFFSLQK